MDERESKTFRLGYGEFAHPGELSIAKWHARKVFFEKIEDLAPEVLRSLQSDIYPRYQAPVSWQREADPDLQKRLDRLWRGPDDPAVFDPRVLSNELLADVQTWLDRFNLRENWVFKSVLGTLALWSLGLTEMHVWAYPPPLNTPLPITPEERQFTFAHAGWHAALQTRQDFEANARLYFEKLLTEYVSDMETLLAQRGMARNTEKRSRGSDDPARHFEWLVRFQVQEWTQRRIAQEAVANEDTIALAIKAAASEIGLTRRAAVRANRLPPPPPK